MTGKQGVLLGLAFALCTLWAGCGQGPGQPIAVLHRAPVDGDDVARALGLEVYRFEAEAPREVDAEVVFWVEYHRRTEQGAVKETHELGRWIGQQRLDDVLLMLPGEANGQKYFCAMGGSSVRGEATSTGMTDSRSQFPRAPDQIKLGFGDPVILAVKIHGRETTGASAPSIDDYLEANLQHEKYERIEVYRLRVQPGDEQRIGD
ncbi:MAG: hypothetical protein R6X33_10115 [Candidatus Brocadiia bacterium]